MTESTPIAAAARINDLIFELWYAAERNGPKSAVFGLTEQQYSVLTLIVEDATITAAEIAERLGVTKGAVSQHLTALEAAGFLSRQPSEHDRRVRLLVLEDRGIAYRDAVQEYKDSLAATYARALSPADVDEILGALTKLRDAIDPVNSDA